MGGPWNATMRRLIVTADDFGAAVEVNEAVEIGHREGVLTAASLMVAAPAAADAAARARAMPGLRVGLHLVLVDGRPTLPPAEVSRLVDAGGRFRDDMGPAAANMFFNARARRELAAEIEAQFAAFAATGLALDHVNAHKHFHLHPTIAGLIGKIGPRYGLRGVRIPVELNHTERDAASPGEGLMRFWARTTRRMFRYWGFLVPDQVYGLRWSGAMTAERLLGLIETLPPGLSEIYLHPATRGGFAGAAAGYRYGEELAALIDPRVAEAARRPDARLGGYADFAREEA